MLMAVGVLIYGWIRVRREAIDKDIASYFHGWYEGKIEWIMTWPTNN